MQSPHFLLEQALHKKGFPSIAGVDEVGRGALAGPIVAASVILPQQYPRFDWNIKESKQLTPKQRESLYRLITAHAVCFNVAVLDNTYIDTHGMSKANTVVVKNAVFHLRNMPDFVLFDMVMVKGNFSFSLPFHMITHGDAISASIAAASVIAKVVRDSIMEKLGRRYHHYYFEKHKGYGTRLHKHQLDTFGPCPLHRYSFAPIKNLAFSGRKFEV